jgi:hypothetical protein
VSADKNNSAAGNRVKILTSAARASGNEHRQSQGIARKIEPEPWLKAMTPRIVRLSNGKFRFSDIFMSVEETALSKEEALDARAVFIVNGRRYGVVAASLTSHLWEFVIRER